MAGKSAKNKLVLKVTKGIKELPQAIEVTTTGEIIEGPEIVIEPSQIDLFPVWKIFVDRVKNSLSTGA